MPHSKREMASSVAWRTVRSAVVKVFGAEVEVRTVTDTDPKPESVPRAQAFAMTLTVATVATYYLVIGVWLPGTDGCGPAGNTVAAVIWEVAPFALPCLAATVFLAVGSTRNWRRSALGWGVFTIVFFAGMVEVFVFLFEFGAHHCGE